MAETKTDNRSFNKRLMDAMAEMENPTKSKQAYKYKYETLEQVLAIVRPALANNGIALTQGQQFDAESGGWVLVTQVFDKDNKVTLDVRKIVDYDDAQKAGSWETYMRRYALRTAFGLTGEDDDGAATTKPSKPKFTEVASDAQMRELNNAIAQYGEICNKDSDAIVDALLKTKALNGANFEALTPAQAETAFTQISVWISKTEKFENEDIPF